MMRWVVILFVLLGVMPAAHAVTVERVVSPKGIEAWLVQDRTNPMLSVALSFAGGDSVGKVPGVAAMTAALLDEGAGTMDARAFQSTLDDRVIGLSFSVDSDYLRGNLKTLSEHRDVAFDMLRLALTQPRFDAEPVARIRAQILSSLARDESDPDALALREFLRLAFGSHPYGRTADGSQSAIKAITTKDLRDYARDWLVRDGLKISVVGDITPDELGILLDKTFGALLDKAPHPVSVPEVAPFGQRTVKVVSRNQPQTVAMFGQMGPKRDHPDWYAAYVLNYVLGGGGFSSRLMEEVREKRGLAYSTYAYLVPKNHSGLWLGGVSTENSRFGQSFAVIREQWDKMAKDGLTEKELADAKTYLTGSFALQQESTGAIARLLQSVQENNLGLDFLERRNALIDGVTQDDIRRVAAQWLKPDNLVWVAVGQPDLMQETTPNP